MVPITVNLKVNGIERRLQTAANRRLLDLLRDDLGLMGTKEGCGIGECGACTILMDGRKVNSCMVLAGQAEGATVVTIEGLGGPDERLHPLQQAFIEAGAVQCGFCTPGMIMSAADLLEKNPSPSDEEIKSAVAGNICRCGAYAQIIDAVRLAAEQMKNKRQGQRHGPKAAVS
ncbi:MAG: (2Fe-2S)-binding protein [Spirochaetota bacterium]